MSGGKKTMKVRYRKALVVVSVLLVAAMAMAQSIGDLIKIGGIGLAVRHFGPDINKAVNGIQGFSDSEATMTKVVPILSVGQGGYIGAAQVMGPPSAVNQVVAVGQIEGRFAGSIRIKALIPISSEKNLSNIQRVAGVGVSGIIDLQL
jgi:hypothetical protein